MPPLLGWAAVAAAAFFALLDGWYLLRVPLSLLWARWLLPTAWDLLEEQSLGGLVLPSDLDFLGHMNNARYLREADVARGVHLTRCGLLRAARALGAHMVLAASCCRYRRSLRCLERFAVRTRLLGWDERAFLLQQRFVSRRDGFVCAVLLVRLHVVGASPGRAVEHLCRRKYDMCAVLRALRSNLVMSASCSRYRRSLNVFERFVIHTRCLGWDDRAIYVEQFFVRPGNGFVVAVVLCRFHVTGSTPAMLMEHVAGKKVESPELPEEVLHWLKYNECSSQRMRAERGLQNHGKDN